MRRVLVVVAVVVGLLVAWLALGRQLVLLVDTFVTEGEPVTASGPFVYSRDSLLVGGIPLELTTPHGKRDVRFDADSTGRVTVHTESQVFALGTRRDTPAETNNPLAGPYDTVFVPDPGDTVTFRAAHSVIAWPTPLDLNFMTGNSPSWRRNTYYTLSWRKPDGRTLDMTWRYEQWLYDDWASPQMTAPGRTGLVRVSISSAD